MAEQPYQLKPIHPLATVLNHLRLIGAVTMVGTLVLGLLVLKRVKPVYSADAGIEVTLLHSRILVWDQEKQFSSRYQYTDYVNTLVRYIVSFENVTAALRRLQLPNAVLEPGDDDRETYFRFIRKVNVQHVRDTHLINISLEDSQPRDLDVMVNALMDTFMDRHYAAEQGKNDARILYLREEMASKQTELEDRYGQLDRLIRELGTSDFQPASNPHHRNLEFLREAVNGATLNRIEAQYQHNTLLTAAERQKELGLEPHIEEFVYQDLNTVEMKNLTFSVREELNRQATFFKPDHPSNQRLRQFADTSQEYLDEALGNSREKAAEIFYGKLEIDQEVARVQSQANLDARFKTEGELRRKLNKETTLLIQTAPKFSEAIQVQDEIARLEERIAEMDSRIEDLIIEAKEPGRLKVQSRARPPKYPQRDRRKIMLVIAAGLSLMTAVFLAFAIDFLDTHLIDPRYIQQIIGTRPTGVMPHREGIADFGQLLRKFPESYHADQFLRTMPKVFPPPEEGAPDRIYAVTTLSHGAGGTSFALNSMTYLQKVGRKAGLLEVADNGATLPQRSADWQLSEGDLPLGPKIAGRFPLEMRHTPGQELYHFSKPCEKVVLSNQDLMAELLDRLSKRNACLIVDAPPLLKNAEAELLCKLADVVILVVSGPLNTSGELKRGTALLEELGVKKCAVIANDLPLLQGGYFSKAIAAYEGKDVRYHLLGEIRDSVRKALDFRRRPAKGAS